MIDKTPFIKKFKQVFEETYYQAITDELATKYFEILYSYYSMVFKWLKVDKVE